MTIEKISTCTYAVSQLGPVAVDLLIGGKDPEKFIPNVNKSFKLRSDTEWFFINVNRPAVIVTAEKETFDAIKEDISLKIGDVEDKIGIVGTNWSWDTIFYSKPLSNIIEFRITHSPGIEFYYQDTLENDWKRENGGYKELSDYLKNNFRPDDVVGSYAVYCNAGGILTQEGKVIHAAKTGKLTHIYRPVAVDAKSNWTWCSLSISDAVNNVRTMTITVPDDFLSSAVYPVKV